LDHPPYSADLAPADFWLFPKVKLAMKGDCYDTIQDIQRECTVVLNAIPQKEYSDCFRKPFNRFQLCIDIQVGVSVPVGRHCPIITETYAMKKSNVFEWHTRFKEGQEDVQDDPRSGQPKTQRTTANVDRVRTLVLSDRRLGVRLIAEELNMDLGMIKYSVKIVLRIVTHDEKKRRLHFSLNVLRNAEMSDRAITGDGTWCFQYDPETKRQRMVWKAQNSPSVEKSTYVSLAVQDHACVFLRSQGDSSL
ncbi:hypothetical protein B7P43_G02872, partial [Cryptotermes secundus]